MSSSALSCTPVLVDESMVGQVQSIADEMLGKFQESGEKFSGETKEVRVTLSALIRVEYVEVIQVPVEFDKNSEEVLMDNSYRQLEGEDYVSDEEYWKRDTSTVKPV
ncbi:MAG: hypothetical protein ACJAS1_000574 [Oleiphilaceae bacterium]|jgi:hypothetical protein